MLFLSELFYPYGGGAELATYLYAGILGKANYRVAVVTNRFQGDPSLSSGKNLTVYRLPLFGNTSSVKYAALSRIDVPFSNWFTKLLK
jgi:hypothetical protein